ncbi:patatin family protein [uncultured Ruminococcus sp.]|uniref:patatin-like phospholipase family protein n=1 Tax=uncultured Ruminococcus sp. TaxID=165186 RepID=UPI002931498D|nr:patatin family protein [uncultured Ruminococcus sp.]
MSRIGLVLEGGAMRGMFTAGVLDVFMENGVSFPAMVGVSAGAAFGCNYKSRQIGRVIRYNKRFCQDKRYCSIHSLITTGDLFGADFCYREIPEKLDPFDTQAYDENPMAFYVVATNIYTGKPVYKRLDKVDENCYLWMRASASMPMVSKPVQVDGYTLLDGGMSDSIPLRFMQKLGYEKNVVVLTRPRSYRKKQSNRALFKVALRKYPAMIDVMTRRHEMYAFEQHLVLESEKLGKTLVLCPDTPLDVGRVEHDPEKLQSAYDEGRRIALRDLDKVKAFLQA